MLGLQLPTSFRYRRSNLQDNRRGSERTFRRDFSETDLSAAIQASLEVSSLSNGFPDVSASSAGLASASEELTDHTPLVPHLESLSLAESELSARYREAVSQNTRNATPQESSFPPLPVGHVNSQSRSSQDNSSANTLAARLRRQNKVNVLISPSSSVSGMAGSRSSPNNMTGLSSGSGKVKAPAESQHSSSVPFDLVHSRPASAPDSSSSLALLTPQSQQVWPALNRSSIAVTNSGMNKLTAENEHLPSSYSSSLQARNANLVDSSSSFSSSKNKGGSSRVNHSASAPNLISWESFDSADFPPVSGVQKARADSKVVSASEDIHSANKSLVERIRGALDFDQDKYSTFKDISAEYRQGSIDAETYLVYVEQYGLSHLVLELARLCPDVSKQKDLIEAYNQNFTSRENGSIESSLLKKGGGSKKGKEKGDNTGKSAVNGSKKGKEKAEDVANTTSKYTLVESFTNTVRELQSGYKPAENEIEVLSKDGYRSPKGKSIVMVDNTQAEAPLPDRYSHVGVTNGSSNTGESNHKAGESDGRNKQRKKTSKFYRVRLGDGSAGAILDLKNENSNPDTGPDPNETQNDPKEGLPSRGVWRNGGGQKLFAMTSRGQKK